MERAQRAGDEAFQRVPENEGPVAQNAAAWHAERAVYVAAIAAMKARYAAREAMAKDHGALAEHCEVLKDRCAALEARCAALERDLATVQAAYKEAVGLQLTRTEKRALTDPGASP